MHYLGTSLDFLLASLLPCSPGQRAICCFHLHCGTYPCLPLPLPHCLLQRGGAAAAAAGAAAHAAGAGHERRMDRAGEGRQLSLGRHCSLAASCPHALAVWGLLLVRLPALNRCPLLPFLPLRSLLPPQQEQEQLDLQRIRHPAGSGGEADLGKQYLWRLSDSGLVRAEVEDLQVGWVGRVDRGRTLRCCCAR